MQSILTKDDSLLDRLFPGAELVNLSAVADLAKATYFIIEPTGLVSIDEGSEQYAPLSPLECALWTISAGFSTRPPMMLAIMTAKGVTPR